MTLWTVASQAPLSMGFSRQEYWSGLLLPSPGDVPTQGSNLGLLYGRQIFYNLNHQGSPFHAEGRANANVLGWNKFGDVLPQAAIRKYHRLGGLNNNFLSSGRKMSENRVPVCLGSDESSLTGLQTAGYLLTHRVFTWHTALFL